MFMEMVKKIPITEQKENLKINLIKNNNEKYLCNC